jgi:hypothetical protein
MIFRPSRAATPKPVSAPKVTSHRWVRAVVRTLRVDSPLDEVSRSIIHYVNRSSSASRGKLLNLCKQFVHNKSLIQDEQVRVLWAKLTVALLPESLKLIRKVLRRCRTALHYELHFSLFCFLDLVNDRSAFPNTKGIQKLILAEVENYLKSVPADKCYAAWMAGDLLGDHWDLRQSLPVLLSAAEYGRYVAGRLGALHGLCHAADRCGELSRDRIRKTIARIAKRDRSRRVREEAKSVLRGSSCCVIGPVKRIRSSP